MGTMVKRQLRRGLSREAAAHLGLQTPDFDDLTRRGQISPL